MPNSQSTTFLRKHGYLLLLIPPLSVYLLAVLLFDFSMTTNLVKLTSSIGAHIISQDISQLSFELIEMKPRYIWFTTTLINLVVCLYVAVLCSTIIYRSHEGQRLMTVTSIGCILIILGILSLVYSAMTQNAIFELIYNFSFSTLQATGLYEKPFLNRVETILLLVNTLAIIVPSILLLAFSSTLAPPPHQDTDRLTYLTSQMRHLKGVLNAGSALLIAGILHMSAWLRWPAGLLSDPTEQSALSGAVLAITMYWGATFTLMLITIYGPAASYLSSQARVLAERAQQAGTIQDPQRWLHDHHFSITLGEQLPQISVLLGPVLAGPIGSFLMSHVNS